MIDNRKAAAEALRPFCIARGRSVGRHFSRQYDS
jgi:hypothetical protein